LEIFAAFFAGTLIELVTWWLEENEPYTIEDMVKYFQQMITFGALGTFDIAKIEN